MVWKSYFPTFLHKCLWFSFTVQALHVHARSLFLGVRRRRNLGSWWKGVLWRFVKRFTLSDTLPVPYDVLGGRGSL